MLKKERKFQILVFIGIILLLIIFFGYNYYEKIKSTQIVSINQGVFGKISVRTGNCMPSGGSGYILNSIVQS